MKKFLILVLSALFISAGISVWAGSGYKPTYNVSEKVYDEIWADYEDGEGDDGVVDSYSNTLTVNGSTFNGNIITGQSEKGNAYQNNLYINGGIINSPDLKAGVSDSQDATENTVVIRDVTVQSNIVAGDASVNARDNTVTLNNATVNYNSTTQNQVIAGKGYSGEVEYNYLNINSGSVLDTTAAAGYSDNTGDVFYNTVTVSGASSINNTSGSNAVFGGYSKSGDVYNNQITLRDASAVAADLYGGYSNSSVAERNLVLVEKADITADVYGGYTAAGSQAYENEVRVTGGKAAGIVAGGWAEGSGKAQNNKVSFSSSAALEDSALVYGGYAAQGDALSNKVTLNTASAGQEAYGGYSQSGAATNNTLAISGAASGGQVMAGGYSAAGAASGNTLSIGNSNLASAGQIYGGYGAAGASENVLNISSSALSASLYGGYATTGASSSNRVNISGGSVTGNVYGGYSAQGESSGNTVQLNNVTVNGDVYAGYTEAAEGVTNNNTLVLSGNTQINGDFYGGNGTTSTGNSLLLNNYSGTVGAINNFDKVTLRGLSNQVTFTADVQNVNVELYGKPSEVEQTLAYTPAGSTLSLNRNSLGAYAYTLESVAQGSQAAWNVKGQYQNDLAKPYAQAQLAGLALAAQGADMLSSAFDEAIALNTDNNSFGGVQYYDNSYDTGSGFDMQSFVLQGGRWWKPGEHVLGVYGQYAHGHFSTDPKDATGGIDNFALGGFALLPYSDEGRFEFTLKAGYQKGDFNSDELSSSLDQDTFYGGLSAGLVQNVSALQLYGKLNWLYLAGDKVHDNLGQSVKFKDVQSLNGKVGARLHLGTLVNHYKPYLAVAGIYELDGDSNTQIDGHKVSDVDLGGLTGQAELGITYENNETLMPMKSSLSVFGLTGQAEGWGANVRLAFSF